MCEGRGRGEKLCLIRGKKGMEGGKMDGRTCRGYKSLFKTGRNEEKEGFISLDHFF